MSRMEKTKYVRRILVVKRVRKRPLERQWDTGGYHLRWLLEREREDCEVGRWKWLKIVSSGGRWYQHC